MKEIACVGAGLSGAVVARELAELDDYHVTVFEQRREVAGNCHTARDPETGIRLHVYGPHIFHTSDEGVWRYVNRFAEMVPFEHRVRAVTRRGVFSLPTNLLTICQFFGQVLSPTGAQRLLATLAEPIAGPKNFEEQALSTLGRELYENFIQGYTRKQWGVDPTELPASVLKRLPVRFNFDDRHHDDIRSAIPRDGYTKMVRRILRHRRISVKIGVRFSREYVDGFDHVFTSAPIDEWYGFGEGCLRYRTLRFERFDSGGDFQGCAVVNYCDPMVPWTRITEHKYFTPWEEHDRTVCYREYSEECLPRETPFYPMRLASDLETFKRYAARAATEPRTTFVGRLGTYRYLDMDTVIAEAIRVAREFHDKEREKP